MGHIYPKCTRSRRDWQAFSQIPSEEILRKHPEDLQFRAKSTTIEVTVTQWEVNMSQTPHSPRPKRAPRRSLSGKKVTPPEKKSGDQASEPVFIPRVRERNFALSILFTTLKLFFFALLVLGVTGIGAVLGLFEGYTNTVPELDISKIENQSQTSFIYDKDGTLITTYAGLENRTNATYEELPKYLVDAIVSIEDERFFHHNGIDLKRIAGAFLNNLTSSSTQGGSTITQQLIKMRVLSSEQTYKRKLQEAYLAVQLEKQYSKEDILTAYLNTINLGSGNYGVKAAAQDYFGKELKDLTIRPGQALIFHSRNSEEGLPVKRDGKGPMEDYVHMSPEAVEYAHSKGVSLLGFDYSLPEKSPGLDAVIHRMCFERDILIMETLNLKGVPTGDYTLLALPLKIVHADGAPVRAVLLEE